MAFEEISKRDLLDKTGISYGQLYRWKRQGLIPEEWFIKKASFTGQETYFPKELVLDRIDKILELKDDKSLEEISDIIHSHAIVKEFYLSDLLNYELLIHKEIFSLVKKLTLSFDDIVLLKILDQVYTDETTLQNLEQCYGALDDVKQGLKQFHFIYLLNKADGIGFILLKEELEVIHNLPAMVKINIKSLIDNMKLVLFI